MPPAASRTLQLACLIAVALLAPAQLPARADDADVQRGAWRMGADDAVVYEITSKAAAETSQLSLPKHYIIHASELANHGEPGRPAYELAEVALALIFRSPCNAPSRRGKFRVPVRFERTSFGSLNGSGFGKLESGGALKLRYVLKVESKTGSSLRLTSLAIDADLETSAAAPGLQRADFRVQARYSATSSGSPEIRVDTTGTCTLKRVVSLRNTKLSQDVRAASDRGRKYLATALGSQLALLEKAAAPTDGAVGGATLATFSLLRAGLASDHPVIERAFAVLTQQPLRTTYNVSLLIMALEARHVVRQETTPDEGYTTVARFQRQPVPRPDLLLIQRAAQWLLAARSPAGTWWYRGIEDPARPKTAAVGDHSNTQFALLALHAAQRCGLNIPASLWQVVAKHFLNTQEPTGPEVTVAVTPLGESPPGATREVRRTLGRARARGWSYGTGRLSSTSSYQSMSGAGLSSLIIAKEGLEATASLDPVLALRIEASLRDAAGWFQLYWSPRSNSFRGSQWYYYALYSVEKAGDIAGLETFGRRAWWAEGALELLERQGTNGSWSNTNQTSFALLFLNRATIPSRIVVEKPTGPVTGVAGSSSPELDDHVVLENVGKISVSQAITTLSAPEKSTRRKNLKLVMQAYEELSPERRPAVLPALVQAQSVMDRAVQRFANQAIVEITGLKRPSAETVTAWHHRWEALATASAAGNTETMDLIRGTLASEDSTLVLRRAALAATGRLRAVEVAGEVINELESSNVEHRGYAHAILVSLVGKQVGFDPFARPDIQEAAVAAWRSWWKSHRQDVILGTKIGRAVAKLRAASGDEDSPEVKEARSLLLFCGKRSVPALIDGLLDEGSRGRAADLLQRITGQDHGTDVEAWRQWWNAQEKTP